MTVPNITIAVDGFSSCGKSTLAKQLAKQLDYLFIDSGAMYRGVTLYALEHQFIVDGKVDEEKVKAALPSIRLEFVQNPESREAELLLNGTNVATEIRSPKVSSVVSKISTIKEVREKLVNEQRAMGIKGGIVMDGRDIGSVVFPDAELKIFVTADIETRTERRFLELKEKGIDISREAVSDNLTERDFIDSTREFSPLVCADDAIVLDNSRLSKEEQLKFALSLVQEKLLEVK